MKVLVVHSQATPKYSSFIEEQKLSLENIGIQIVTFHIKGKGVKGYLKCLPEFKKVLKSIQPDVIHAHYGLSGLFANFQRRIPVVTTFHGSDIYIKRNRYFSLMAHFLSRESIFVSQKLKEKLKTKKGVIITSGVDTDHFVPLENGKESKQYAMFSGAFDNPAKNYSLAQLAIDTYNEKVSDNNKIELIELKNLSRDEVAIRIREAQFLLITSFYEGSSQVLKEAMASNCPVIAVDVGSVSELLVNGKSGIIAGNSEKEINEAIHKVVNNRLSFLNGREQIVKCGITLELTAQKLHSLYRQTMRNSNK